ncbi:MAG: hypothetical protein NC344_06850 [Bacteroidales bacterium]|nr:hypothetical protein [Bacteroidales bacterium]MCM1147535.1 hypothetical protein [Bacteroidales bacterium]MCM1206325.1 hypothetical protein [Bacillota bacterium]MCM1511247.1 hypothetical protein [Clostridium sp.]
MIVKTEDGRQKDVPVAEVTPENYIVPENEKGLYHCIVEVRKFDTETGKRLSVPRLQKFGKKVFEINIADNLHRQGYTVTILHNPNDSLREKEEQEQKLLAKQLAEQEKQRQAEIDEAVAKALAEHGITLDDSNSAGAEAEPKAKAKK